MLLFFLQKKIQGLQYKAMKRIYLDYAAATPIDKRVLRAMTPFFARDFQNPSAFYKEGVFVRKHIEEARKEIAKIIAGHSDEIIFTSGGTEGNNLALQGVVKAFGNRVSKKPHVIASSIEHASVRSVLRVLKKRDEIELTEISIGKDGAVSLSELKDALRENTALVSVMQTNNEIGTIEPIAEVAKIIRNFKKKNNTTFPLLHTDACQSGNYLELNVERLGVDLMTLNSGKIYGPKGIGALFVRRGVTLKPLIYGGGQEAGLRGGTENVAGIVGFAKALSIAQEMREKESKRLSTLRDYFFTKLKDVLPESEINGSLELRLPNNINISIPNTDSGELVARLDAKGIAVSAKSACGANDDETSHVTIALGINENNGSIRLTLGRDTKKSYLDYVLKILPGIIKMSQKY